MSNEKELDPHITGGLHRPNRLLLLGFLIMSGIVVWLLLKSFDRPLPPAPTVVPIAAIKDSVKAAKQRAQHTIDSLTLTVRKFRTLADSGKAVLAQLKARGNVLNKFTGSKVSNFTPIVGLTSETLRAGVSHFTTSPNDYEGGDPAAIIAEQQQIIKDQDSACFVTIEALEGLAQTKDGIIAAKDTLISAMDRQLAVALTNQASLQNYTKQLRKAAKRARFGRGFWRTAAVALTGIIVYKSIK